MTHVQIQRLWRRRHLHRKGLPPPIPSARDRAQWAALIAAQLGPLADEAGKMADDESFATAANGLRIAQMALMGVVARGGVK